MWAGGQLFNLHKYNAVPPRSVRVRLEYGRDRSYGHTVEAEIRELLTHVPVWDGKPGVLKASRTLNADQFFVHAHMDRLTPGTKYHYRFRYTAGREVGVTPRDFSVTFETVDWSQARYDDYGFIALDVTPAKTGHRTTMVLRFINEQGQELDRAVFSRTAGEVLH